MFPPIPTAGAVIAIVELALDQKVVLGWRACENIALWGALCSGVLQVQGANTIHLCGFI